MPNLRRRYQQSAAYTCVESGSPVDPTDQSDNCYQMVRPFRLVVARTKSLEELERSNTAQPDPQQQSPERSPLPDHVVSRTFESSHNNVRLLDVSRKTTKDFFWVVCPPGVPGESGALSVYQGTISMRNFVFINQIIIFVTILAVTASRLS